MMYADDKSKALDFEALRSGGIIKQRQRDLFTLRLKCPGGRVPLDKLEKILEVARRYGGEYAHLSVRQSVEIPYVNYEDVARVQEELSEAGAEFASCGPRVRVPTACSGCEYNPNGLTDTQGMAQRVCDRYFGKRTLPHKFKIAFSGCPIDCVRTNGMDLGFQGAVEPSWEPESCSGCGICAVACAEDAIESSPDNGEPIFHPEKCLYCGDCIRACPTESWTAARTGWMVRAGGKHGRHPVLGQLIARFVPDESVEAVIEAIVDWYEKHGRGKGRVRLGTILQDKAAWEKFIRDARPALGEWAVKNPRPPQACEIHYRRKEMP